MTRAPRSGALPAKTLVLGIVLALALPALADSREAEYIARRQAAVAELRRLSHDCNAANAEPIRQTRQAEARWREELRLRLVTLLGDRPPPGFAAHPAYNPSVLACGLEAGGLDGLLYRRSATGTGTDPGGEAMLLATSETLLRDWLSRQKGRQGDGAHAGAGDLAQLLQGGVLYTLAFGANAGLTPFARLPVRWPDGSAGAALLAEQSQTRAIRPPQLFAFGLVRGERAGGRRVELALVKPERPVAPIEECEQTLAVFDEEAKAAHARGVEHGRKVEDEGEHAYVTCWVDRLPRMPVFRLLTRQAQAIADRIFPR